MMRKRAPIRKSLFARLCVERLEDRTLLTAGMLDPTFGVGGSVFTDIPGPTNNYGTELVLIQPDGKIVVAGNSNQIGTGSDFALARYNANGSLDTSFGVNGTVLTDFGSSHEVASSVAVQADGKIVVAGYSYDQSYAGAVFALARYNANGSLDTSFDGDGKLTTDFGSSYNLAYGVAVQADGKIVAAGYTYRSGTGGDFALARYNADGSLDTGFDGDGKLTTDFGSTYDIAYGVAVQADGKIVAAGTSYQGSTSNDFALARYNTNGSLDTGFDGDGKLTTDFGSTYDIAYGAAVQADGKIIVAGYTGSDFALARYNTNGSLDTSFDTDGKVTTNFGASNYFASGVAVQADGKIVAAGNAYQQGSSSYDFALARYNTNGSLDSSFDGDGKLTTDFGFYYEIASGVAVQADGKIVAAGYIYRSGTGGDFALARYNANGSLDNSFDGDGRVTTDIIGPSDNYASFASSIALQADGKIVVAVDSNGDFDGDFVLVRYNANGSLDTSFGTNGTVKTDFGSSRDYAATVVIQADGKIVAAGNSHQSGTGSVFALARYNANGSLDTSFDGDGKVTTDFGESFFDAANAVAVQADGKIVAAGYTYSEYTYDHDFALARYNANGSLDTSFDGDGKLTTGFGPFSDSATAVAVQADGKIVAVGWSYVQGSTADDFALARFNADGSLDTSFDGDGRVTTDFRGSRDGAYGVAIQADGKIVVVGESYGGGTSSDFALARYNANGSLDTSFDGDGKVFTDFGSSLYEGADGVAVQADGKIVAAGYSHQSSTGLDFALARYNANGSLDTSFDSDGKVTTDFGSLDDGACSVAIQPDGKIVAAGWSYQDSTGYDLVVARYEGVMAPAQQIAGLISHVQSLVPVPLNNGQGNSLLVKLQAAMQQLDNGNTTAAINQLQAFVNAVQAFIDTGKLTSSQGQPLIDAANAIISQLGGSPLYVSGGIADRAAGVESLGDELLRPVVEQAIALWAGAGVAASRLATLRDVAFQIADLPGTRLGVATSTGVIWIDRDAAGYGWFVQSFGGASGGIDLLSVVAHELGHLLGFDHSAGEDVMAETLAPGQRRLPQLVSRQGIASEDYISTLRIALPVGWILPTEAQRNLSAPLAADLEEPMLFLGPAANRRQDEVAVSPRQNVAPVVLEGASASLTTLLSEDSEELSANALDFFFADLGNGLLQAALLKEGAACL